jgi:hypothetical protein
MRKPDGKVLEDVKLSWPFFMQRRWYHDDHGAPGAVCKRGHHCNTERNEGFAHSHFVREHNAGLIRKPAQNFRYRPKLPKGIVLADTVVLKV